MVFYKTDDSQISSEIFPVTTSQVHKKKFSIIAAISVIQQYYYLEKMSEDLPKDFLSLEKRVQLFHAGFSNGFIESILVTFLSVLLIPILADENLKSLVVKYFPPLEWDIFNIVLNYSPILIFGLICCFLTKYRVGCVTKIAVDQILLGRMCSLVVKGVFLFVVMIWLSEQINQSVAWELANNLALYNYQKGVFIYKIILSLKPGLIYSAFQTFFIFILGVTIPFFTIWLSSAIKSYQKSRLDLFWKN